MYQTSRSWCLFRNVLDKNGFPYANVLACFVEISQTTGKEVNVKVWISPFQRSEEDSALKADTEHIQEVNATAYTYPNSSPSPPPPPSHEYFVCYCTTQNTFWPSSWTRSCRHTWRTKFERRWQTNFQSVGVGARFVFRVLAYTKASILLPNRYSYVCSNILWM